MIVSQLIPTLTKSTKLYFSFIPPAVKELPHFGRFRTRHAGALMQVQQVFFGTRWETSGVP
jgi:hypothetical protein